MYCAVCQVWIQGVTTSAYVGWQTSESRAWSCGSSQHFSVQHLVFNFQCSCNLHSKLKLSYIRAISILIIRISHLYVFQAIGILISCYNSYQVTLATA